MGTFRVIKKGPDKMLKQKSVVLSLFILIIFVLVLNFYFASVMNNTKKSGAHTGSLKTAFTHSKFLVASSPFSHKVIFMDSPRNEVGFFSRPTIRNATAVFASSIKIFIDKLPTKYTHPSKFLKIEVSKLWTFLKPSVGVSTQLWSVAKKWVGGRYVVPAQSPLLGSILKTISTAKIVKAQNAPGGTQLKLLVTLEGGQQALFKPQWYRRNESIEGPVYSGKDRHNAEVAAFHLALLLGLRRVPLTAGRSVNLQKEIVPVATKSLLKTFSIDGENNTCFYGNCHYCRQSEVVCGKKEQMEGALILMLPLNLKLRPYRSPWQRTYKENKAAKWELDVNYCESVKANKIYNPLTGPRLMDLVDAAVFDFLIDNGDRHHYEVLVNVSGAAVMFIDNGKSFGHPFQDHLDILAPFYQCCLMRRSTWERLMLFTGDTLGAALEKLLSSSSISPVLSKDHYLALNRRVRAIFATAEFCFQKLGEMHVVIDDGYR